MVDDALGEEVRVTVVAAGFDKTSPMAGADQNRFENRLSRLLEEPVRTERRPASGSALPSILGEDLDDEADIFAPTNESEPASVSFDAEEDLDIPDFLKN